MLEDIEFDTDSKKVIKYGSLQRISHFKMGKVQEN